MRALPILLLAAACGAPPVVDEDGAPPLGEPDDAVWRTAIVDVDGEQTLLSIQDFDGTYVLEDDIILDPRDVELRDDLEGQQIEQGLATVRNGRLWPNGVVYYKFSAALPQYLRDRVKDAMAAWERRTTIRFEKAGDRAAYVLIKPFDKPYCRASIGHQDGVTYMWLNDVCTVGLVKHELGHTIGLYHEQSRQDRDDHVKILWDNIKDGFGGNFAKYRATAGKDVGAYDIDSLMHYSSRAFSKNGEPTIVRRSDGLPFGGWRTRISDGDARGVDRRYGNAF
jgi:hypothetical protein